MTAGDVHHAPRLPVAQRPAKCRRDVLHYKILPVDFGGAPQQGHHRFVGQTREQLVL